MTEKLYWQDSTLTAFRGEVLVFDRLGDISAVVLDKTAFYPTGGGQPCDHGLLNGHVVHDVQISGDGIISHYLRGEPSFVVGDTVEGSVDWSRRRDLSQQHSGQHIFSQVALRLFRAETKGFRLNEDTTEIDLTLEGTPTEITQKLQEIENASNEIFFENRRIKTYLVSPEEAANLPLRNALQVKENIRVVEIPDFDFSPCAGTHMHHTGQLGSLVVRDWERAKQMTRVRFLCGARVRTDYRRTNGELFTLGEIFSAKRDEVPVAISQLRDEKESLERRLSALLSEQVEKEAEVLSAQARDGIVCEIFGDRGKDIKALGQALARYPGLVSFLAVIDNDEVRLVFSRSNDRAGDMGVLMNGACKILNGRGGGSKSFAQGGGSGADVEALLEQMKMAVKRS